MNQDYQQNLHLLLYHFGDSIGVDEKQVDRFIQQYIDLEPGRRKGDARYLLFKVKDIAE